MRLTPRAYAAAAAGAWGLALAASRTLGARPPGGAARWQRTNHAGRQVSLLEGPALIIATAAGALASLAAGTDPRPAQTALVASLGPGAAGLVDDLAGDRSRSKGLRGHLRALAHGELTTGVVKILVLGASGALAADRLHRVRRSAPLNWSAPLDRPAASGSRAPAAPRCRAAHVALEGAVIAGSANLANLLDLRPGRALKACLLAAGVLGIREDRALPGALLLGASLALLPADLSGRTMLGDGGANPAGALAGTALVAQSGTRGQLVALAVITGLTLASERVSFTAVIEATPGLRDLDAWGRS